MAASPGAAVHQNRASHALTGITGKAFIHMPVATQRFEQANEPNLSHVIDIHDTLGLRGQLAHHRLDQRQVRANHRLLIVSAGCWLGIGILRLCPGLPCSAVVHRFVQHGLAYSMIRRDTST